LELTVKRVAILGGGPGGLFTALLLRQKSVEELNLTLFEDTGRLGGKVLTKRFNTVPVLYEAGVAELYQYGKDPLRLLVTKLLGLPVVRMAGKTVVFEDQVLRTIKDIKRHFGKKTARAIKEFHKHGCSLRTFLQFYDSGWPADNRHPWAGHSFESVLNTVPDMTARRYLEILVHSDLATEPSFTNGLYGLENYLINYRSYCKLYSIEGGIERLIQALRDAVAAHIKLNTPVERVEKMKGGAYRVVCRHDGKVEADDFDAVAVALPVYELPTITWGGKLLEQAMENHHTYYDRPAHYLRITILFQKPFWREVFHESFFLHDAFGGCCVYDESARHDAGPYGVLGWLLAGSNALTESDHDDQILIEKALDSLPKQILAGRKYFMEGYVHRWIGTVNKQPGGLPVKGSKKRHRPEPREHPGLIVVGDYLFD